MCLVQILEDVSEEHARKTITVDPFPHSGVPAASIHPCKHASVMKKLGSMAEASGHPFQVDRYAPCPAPTSFPAAQFLQHAIYKH